VVDQVLHGHTAAHAPADEVDPVEPQGVEHGGQVVGEVPQPAGRVDGQRLGVAVPAQVGGEAVEPLGQGEQGLLPEHRGGDVAVHQDDRLALGAAVVADGGVGAVGGDPLRVDGVQGHASSFTAPASTAAPGPDITIV
jgi:hypothetical protein